MNHGSVVRQCVGDLVCDQVDPLWIVRVELDLGTPIALHFLSFFDFRYYQEAAVVASHLSLAGLVLRLLKSLLCGVPQAVPGRGSSRGFQVTRDPSTSFGSCVVS